MLIFLFAKIIFFYIWVFFFVARTGGQDKNMKNERNKFLSNCFRVSRFCLAEHCFLTTNQVHTENLEHRSWYFFSRETSCINVMYAGLAGLTHIWKCEMCLFIWAEFFPFTHVLRNSIVLRCTIQGGWFLHPDAFFLARFLEDKICRFRFDFQFYPRIWLQRCQFDLFLAASTKGKLFWCVGSPTPPYITPFSVKYGGGGGHIWCATIKGQYFFPVAFWAKGLHKKGGFI